MKAGDRVRRGQTLARVGDSGDSREPHLHFEVTTSPKQGMSQGVPYLIDRYRCKSGSNGSMEVCIHELPLDNSIVTFGETAVNEVNVDRQPWIIARQIVEPLPTPRGQKIPLPHL